MAGFSEDIRVKIPALTHLSRLGYTYRSLHSLHHDPETNIDTETFSKKLREMNDGITDTEIDLFIGKIRVMLNNEDLGREFYEKILSNKTYNVIDYDHPEQNVWECVTEMPCENGGESFRPDITLLINGLPLVFVEVKMPNNHGGMLQEYHRMNDTRFPNTKFRRFLNMTQLMIFSDNKHYDFSTQVPLQGAFYGCRAEKQIVFNVFREENDNFIRNFPYAPLQDDVENYILKDTNYSVIKSSPEYKTNKEYDTPTNSILTSLCSRERLLYLLRFGFVYLDYIDTDTHKHVLQKHVMRYPQLFGTQAIRQRLSEGVQSGIIWHTQGSGKTALSYFATRVLTDYYKRQNIVPKFYFFVDRLDLMEQATNEFSNRGLKVINVETRDELMKTFETTTAQQGNTGQQEIIVVNIQKLKDSDGKVNVQQYAVNIQRVYFLDEAHRDYNPQGSFLARLFESDPKAIRLALTGTPLIGAELKSRDVFGEYISTYYYNRSIEDGFTKKILREDIETSYRLKLQEVWNHLEETIKVKKEDVRRDKILENERYVGALLDYIIDDFKRWRIQQGDKTLAGMIVCETNPQAREMFRQLQERGECGVTAELILHDFYDKETRKGIYEDFKKHGHPDILIVNAMLLTGFDAHQYGYVVDFADIQQNFNDINDAYAQELNQFTPKEQGQQPIVNTVMVSESEIREKMQDVQEVLFAYNTHNAEIFAQELEEVDDRDKLLQIRRKLEDAKAVWNEVRTMGDERLKEVVNLKNVFSHEQEVSGMINEALATIDFRFRKRGENEMEIGSDIKDQMRQKRVELSNEMQECIDPDDEEYVSLTKIIQEHFAKKKFEVSGMAEAKEEIGFMDSCMERIRKINRENANLQAKYRGDSKYVRVHKKIRRYEQKHEATLLSEKEVRQCEALNRIKDAIDVLINNRRELIFNEADFNAQVIGAVAKCLHEIELKAKPDDRRYVAGVLAGEYLREFNVIK